MGARRKHRPPPPGAQEALRTNGGGGDAPGVGSPTPTIGTGYFTVTVIGFDDVAPAALAN